MCGIHCVIDKGQQLASSAPLDRMMHESASRGPNAADTQRIDQTNCTLWLGSQRLAISDPHPRANQPFASSDGRHVLLYNGELYNQYELRNQLLQEGVTFTTQSDTEVLLHWLSRRGVSGLRDLNGMFALIYYDRQKEVLWAARDRHGMKPLYYMETEEYLVLSSETKSIVATDLINVSLYQEAIEPYLCFRYAPQGTTLFREVAPLREGHVLEVTEGRGSEPRSYLLPYQVQQSASSDASDEQLIQKASELLTEAALRHLASDVPTGLFLSGGVDSTLLLALLRREGGGLPPTFTIAHPASDRSFGTDDADFARRAAEQYGAYHEEITVTASGLEEHFETFVGHLDQPVGDSGAFMTYLLAQTAARHVKVVLSGAGADELFGGYHRHWAYYQYLRRYPWVVRALPLARALTAWLPTGRAHPLRQSFRLLKKLASDATDDPTETFAHFISMSALCRPEQSYDALHRSERHDYHASDFTEEYLSYALQHDQQHYLVADVLALSDTMSMAHGLEMRMPYLDQAVVEFANGLPAERRLRHGRKWLLRQLLVRQEGKVYAERRKAGFGLPFGSWLRRPEMPLVRHYLEDRTLTLYGYVSHERVTHLLTQHRRGRHDYGQELWAVLVLAAWLEKFSP